MYGRDVPSITRLTGLGIKEAKKLYKGKSLEPKFLERLNAIREGDEVPYRLIEKVLKDFHEQFSEMYHEAGFKNIQPLDTKRLPGNENHEMGGVRMGIDPKTSLLNKWNQLHACKNVFVTDGSCMTSTSTQNPSLTYMALTARAVDYAVKQRF
jgi:choline dehydrogenase-like flavoprotein